MNLAEGLTILHAEIDGCRVCADVAGFEKPEHLDRGDPGEVMIIGQGPGNAEVAHERAFAGQSGRRLDSWLIQSGADPGDPRHGIYFTSVIKCCHSRGSDFRYMAENCGGFLQRQIEILRPGLVISLGRQAYEQLRFTRADYDSGLCVPVHTSNHLLVSQLEFDFWLMPWPHPSGLNRWHNAAENRSRLESSFRFVRGFLEEGA